MNHPGLVQSRRQTGQEGQIDVQPNSGQPTYALSSADDWCSKLRTPAR